MSCRKILSSLVLVFSSAVALGQTESEIRKSAFNYPQTSFTAGYSSYDFKAKNKKFDQSWKNKADGLNTFGFDLEVPHSDFTNIGIYYRFDRYQKRFFADSVNEFDFRIANFIGAFIRFQYEPASNRWVNFFSRIDVGGGPVIMKFSGLAVQAAAHAGLELYLTEWVGLAVSYGFVEEWAKETLLGNSNEIDKDFKNIIVRSSGRLLQFALKTTYF